MGSGERQAQQTSRRQLLAASLIAGAGGLAIADAGGAATPTAGGPHVAGVKVPERIVPWPASISEAARQYMAAKVATDGTPLAVPPAIAPDDLAGWRKSKEQAEAALAAIMQRRPPPAAGADTTQIGGVTVHVATPQQWSATDQRAILEIHGGAFVFGGDEFCRRGGQLAADLHGVRCYAVDYRLPPEHPFPAALDDCLAVYREVIRGRGPQNVIVSGTSAGGNLAAALVLRARDEGLPLPAAVALRTPEVDLTESGDSFQVNRFVDVLLVDSLASTINAYAQGRDLRDPYLSPLFGDFSRGYPPTYLDAGTRDLFLSNAVRMHRRLRQAKVPVELNIFEAMPHGGFGGTVEDAEAAEELRLFVARHWPNR